MTHPDSGNDSVNDPDDKIAIDAVLLGEGRHPDPFTVLGRHGDGPQSIVRAFWPGARQIVLTDIGEPLQRLPGTDLFQWRGPATALPLHYRLTWTDADGREFTAYDPYCFPPQLSLYLSLIHI